MSFSWLNEDWQKSVQIDYTRLLYIYRKEISTVTLIAVTHLLNANMLLSTNFNGHVKSKNIKGSFSGLFC